MNINPITNLTLAQRNNNNYITKYRKTSYSFKGSYNSDLAKTTREIKKEEGIGWSAGYKKNGFWGGLKGAAKSFFGAGSYAKKKAVTEDKKDTSSTKTDNKATDKTTDKTTSTDKTTES